MKHPIDNQYHFEIVYNLNGEIVGFNLSPNFHVPLTDDEIEKALENYIKLYRQPGDEKGKKMTKEEAIKQLEYTILLIIQDGKDYMDERDIPVLKMAIQALKQQPKIGQWIPLTVKDDDCDCWGRIDSHVEFKCSNCSKISKICSKYCPECGEKKEE